MADEKDLKQAQSTFLTICKAFDEREIRYEKDEENLSIKCRMQSDDLPIEFIARVNADRMLILLASRLPFTVQEDKRLDMAIAVNQVNYWLADGFFEYDIKSGHMFFRLTNSYRESLISEALFMYMVLTSCKIIDKYNDKFLMLSKGMMTLEQFIDKI